METQKVQRETPLINNPKILGISDEIPYEKLEKILNECGTIINNPNLWLEKVKQVLNSYNEHVLSYDDENIPLEMKDVQITDIEYIEYLQGEQKGPEDYTYDLHVTNLREQEVIDREVYITSQDIANYLEQQKSS